VDFLTGHVVDPLQYTQLYEKPRRVLEAWSKWSSYLDTGPSVATKEELTARDQTIQRMQEQINELKQGRGYSKEDVERMIERHLANLAKR
jgi:cupin superfamily acireductone dioxygenase involved in methionine salvage